MDGEAIIAVSAAVVTLVQLVKWAGLRDNWGPVAVLLLSALGVAFWSWSRGSFERATAFEHFAGWIAVALNSAGVFGFTRAATTAVTSAKSPPAGGAGSDPTVKPHDAPDTQRPGRGPSVLEQVATFRWIFTPARRR